MMSSRVAAKGPACRGPGIRIRPDQPADGHGMLGLCDAPTRCWRRSRSSPPHSGAWSQRCRDALPRRRPPGLPRPLQCPPPVPRLPSPSWGPTRCDSARFAADEDLGTNVAEGFALAGFPASADLLTHFLTGKGTEVDYRAGSPISNKALSSSAFRTVNHQVQKASSAS